MTDRHTPGPWELRFDISDPSRPRDVIPFSVWAPKRGIVAEVAAPAGQDWRARADANARLIAAAPDLVAVLEQLVRMNDANHSEQGSHWFCQFCEADRAGGMACVSTCIVETARAALARAGLRI